MTAPFLHYEGKNGAVIDRAYRLFGCASRGIVYLEMHDFDGALGSLSGAPHRSGTIFDHVAFGGFADAFSGCAGLFGGFRRAFIRAHGLEFLDFVGSVFFLAVLLVGHTGSPTVVLAR